MMKADTAGPMIYTVSLDSAPAGELCCWSIVAMQQVADTAVDQELSVRTFVVEPAAVNSWPPTASAGAGTAAAEADGKSVMPSRQQMSQLL